MIVGISGKKQSGKNTVALIWQYLYDYYYNNYKHPITVEGFKEYVKNNHHLKSDWIQKSFAYKIKQIACILIGCTMEQLEDPVFKETPLGESFKVYKYINSYNEIELFIDSLTQLEMYERDLFPLGTFVNTPRSLMQSLGTEFGRNMIHPNIWVNATFADYQPNGAPYNSLGDVFDDLKLFPSETKMPNWVISDVRFLNEIKAIKNRGGILIRVDRDSDSKDSHVSENDLVTYKNWNYVIDNNYSLSELILRVRQIMFKEGIIYE